MPINCNEVSFSNNNKKILCYLLEEKLAEENFSRRIQENSSSTASGKEIYTCHGSKCSGKVFYISIISIYIIFVISICISISVSNSLSLSSYLVLMFVIALQLKLGHQSLNLICKFEFCSNLARQKKRLKLHVNNREFLYH